MSRNRHEALVKCYLRLGIKILNVPAFFEWLVKQHYLSVSRHSDLRLNAISPASNISGSLLLPLNHSIHTRRIEARLAKWPISRADAGGRGQLCAPNGVQA